MLGVIVEAKAYNQASLQHNAIQSPPSHTGGDTPSKSKSGGSCITKWGWDGQQWVKRDLYVPWGKNIPGEYCVAFDPLTRKALLTPPTKAGTAFSDNLLHVAWFRQLKSQSRI